MAGGEENGRQGALGKRLPPPHEPPQPLAQGFPEEQPRLSAPQGEDEREEGGEEEESERSEGQLEGVLDEDTAAEGLQTLGYSALGTEYVYLHLSLPGRELSDISILSGYTHLQKLDLSSNKINDLSCISHMPYLIELDASKNELSTYFDFKPPKNLREVDFSHNQIPKMRDLSAYHSLTKLLLDYNEIEEIRGLEKCHSLTQLGLSHNRLTAIKGLEHLPIRILNLSFNQIEKVMGLKSLKSLRRVDLSCNKINSLQGLEEHELLEEINLEDNQVAELRELEWIGDLPLLRVLNLLKNPLQEQGDYWLSAIFTLLQITELDLKEVSVEEKVAAVNNQDPPAEVVAAEDHRTQVLCHILQPQSVLDSTLPGADEAYPMLVLLGPLACGKRQLSLKICRQFKNFFRFGPCHTTRTAYFGEENRLDYYFISPEEFTEMVAAGKFLATYKYSGHRYGLARDTVEASAREGLATCVHLEIEGVRSLKNTHFKPRYILLVPRDKGKYEEHLRRTGLFSRPEIEEAVSRVDMYLQINEDFPGYFDAVINTDELDEAFTELSRLLKVYMGLEPPGIFDDIRDTTGRTGSRTRPFRGQSRFPGRGAPGATPYPSISDILEPSSTSYPRDLLDVLAAPPGSVEEASLQRRFSAAHRALCGKASAGRFQQFRRELGSEPQHHPQRPLAPLPSDARNLLHEHHVPVAVPEISFRGHIFVPLDPAVIEELWTKAPFPRSRPPGEGRAGKGAETSKETELPAGNPRKSSKSTLGSSPVPQLQPRPGSRSRPVLPPIPPGRKSSNP